MILFIIQIFICDLPKYFKNYINILSQNYYLNIILENNTIMLQSGKNELLYFVNQNIEYLNI